MIHATIETVTPELAREWLAMNTRNRLKKPGKIKQYARDMAAGRWQLNGEAIKFDLNGILLDGQNRLSAVILAECAVQMLVIRGLDSDVQITMDSGAGRTAADNFAIEGEKNATILAAGIRCALTVDAVGYSYLGRYQVSKSEVAEFFAKHPEFGIASHHACRTARFIDCRPGLVAYAIWRFMALNPQEALDFFSDAASCVGLEAGDPALVLAQRFAEARRRREVLTDEMRISMIFRCWNDRRSGRSRTVLKVNSTKGGIIEVPEPK